MSPCRSAQSVAQWQEVASYFYFSESQLTAFCRVNAMSITAICARKLSEFDAGRERPRRGNGGRSMPDSAAMAWNRRTNSDSSARSPRRSILDFNAVSVSVIERQRPLAGAGYGQRFDVGPLPTRTQAPRASATSMLAICRFCLPIAFSISLRFMASLPCRW
jgi:hypothetical protein